MVSRQNRHAARFHELLGSRFGTHGAYRLRRWPDKYDASLCTCFGKIRVLGKKAIARVDGIRPVVARRLDDTVDVQIGFAGPITAQMDAPWNAPAISGVIVLKCGPSQDAPR